MDVKEVITELNKLPLDMKVMCQSKTNSTDIELIFDLIKIDKHDISTFGYIWNQYIICRLLFKE